MTGFFAALQFLTTIPLPARRRWGAEDLGLSFAYFPLVGFLIGACLFAVDWLGRLLFPDVLAAALVLVAWVVLTGALHLDGFADSCDGLLAQKPPAMRLEIMRDSRVGAFGVVGVVSVLILKFAALLAIPLDLHLIALLLAPVLSRWGMAYAALIYPYARTDGGLGALFKSGAGGRALLGATVSAAVLAFAIWTWRGLVVLLVTWGLVWALARFVMSKIPGLTGDTYGAIDEVAEVTLLILIPLLARLPGTW